jgi:hypothetical protein
VVTTQYCNSVQYWGQLSPIKDNKKGKTISDDPIALRVEEIRKGLEPQRFLAFSFDKKSLKAKRQVFWPTNQRLSTVPGIFDAKGESIFNTLSDRLARFALPFLFNLSPL